MRILIINLARANDRRQKMQKQLASLGLEFAFLKQQMDDL
jgi:GR25 family glycosyltransferase involved in LPS biosynthesis